MGLIALNCALFLYELLLGQDLRGFMMTWGLVPVRVTQALQFGDQPLLPTLVTLATSMFLHGGWAHLLGNMWYLWIFGDNVEDRMGHGRFLIFYLSCGITAALAQTMVSPDSLVPMVGASGAVAGVMGAYFVLYPKSRVLTLFPFPLTLIEIPAVYLLGLWFVMQFVNGLTTLAPPAEGQFAGGIAFWAHIAGFGAGVLLIFLFRRPERARVEWWGGPPA